MGSLTICLLTLGAIMLITQGSPKGGDSFEVEFVGWFMISVSMSAVIFNNLMMFWSTGIGGKCRSATTTRCMRASPTAMQGQNQGGCMSPSKRNLTQVVPAAQDTPDARTRADLDPQEKSLSPETTASPTVTAVQQMKVSANSQTPKERLALRKKKTGELAREAQASDEYNAWA